MEFPLYPKEDDDRFRAAKQASIAESWVRINAWLESGYGYYVRVSKDRVSCWTLGNDGEEKHAKQFDSGNMDDVDALANAAAWCHKALAVKVEPFVDSPATSAEVEACEPADHDHENTPAARDAFAVRVLDAWALKTRNNVPQVQRDARGESWTLFARVKRGGDREWFTAKTPAEARFAAAQALVAEDPSLASEVGT